MEAAAAAAGMGAESAAVAEMEALAELVAAAGGQRHEGIEGTDCWSSRLEEPEGMHGRLGL